MRIHITLLFVLIFNLLGFAQWNYPSTKRVDTAYTYFGVTYKDPYAWLEDLKSPEVQNWFRQQAEFSNTVLNKISGRDELVSEWKKLNELRSAKCDNYDWENGRVFYKKTMPGENVGKIYYRKGMSGQEQLLFDPLTYIPGKKLTVESILPSYDGKKLLISYSEGGAEICTIRVLDVDTKKMFHEAVYPSWFGPISWTFDNQSFTYFSLRTADNTSPDLELNIKAKLHRLNDDVKKDIDLFSKETYPDIDIRPADFPSVWFEKDSRNYVFASLSDVSPEYRVFYAPIDQFKNTKIKWKILCAPGDKLVRGMEVIGDTVFAITYKNAKNHKLIFTSLKNPDWEHAGIIADEKDEILESIIHSKDYLYLMYSDGINSHLYTYNLRTKKLTLIELPFSGSATIKCPDFKTNNCMVRVFSWNKPFAEFNFDAEKNIFAPGIFNELAKYPEAYMDLVAEETEVKGYDGAMIPLSIIHEKGIRLDGSNCCLMEGYGAYGYSMTPDFNMLLNSLAVKGVVIAIPHVRGGSEKGEAWYKAGFKTTKPNTWKDFISCAEYLVSKGYTSPVRLAGTGTSAGGILISRAITERPDLFAAAICNVGWANAMRVEFTPNGPSNIPEFGTVKDSVECKALYEMDGMEHVIAGVKYPAVICVGGWNDPRVIAWEPGKFAATLQNASSSGKPVLMKVNYDNGHFTEDRSVTFANFADQYAFVLWQCGHPDFIAKP